MPTWTCELIAYIADFPVESTKSELIDYAHRNGAPKEVIENLRELDDYQVYNTIQDIWPDCPISDEDYLYNKEEYEL
ncbi:MAG TPA: DUF2795 domain-containing protein [Candidatus Angelobacter sp.]|jgi:hypothetical protein|nr:DUF2795 domain-containing protein [Candidatus Angelobacter sp.]